MSKILRRPMFRGGPVDSRGTGITSGLIDKPKRGLVDEPGGYAGEVRTGGDILQNVNRNFDLFYQDPNMDQLRAFQSLGMGNPFRDKFDLVGRLTRPAENSIFDKIKESAPIVQEQKQFEEDTDKNQEILENKEFFSGNIDDVTSQIKTTDDDNNDTTGNNTSSTVVDEKDVIRQQAELFKELLGEDKDKRIKDARISDASDYLLKFFEGSQKEGATVGSAAADVAGFATSRDSKTEKAKAANEKIDQTATVLAINDYIAGKRSKEEIQEYFAKIGAKARLDAKSAAEYIQASDEIAFAKKVKEGFQSYAGARGASVPSFKETTSVEMKENFKFSPEDIGVVFIETDTNKAYTYDQQGNPIPVYSM